MLRFTRAAFSSTTTVGSKLSQTKQGVHVAALPWEGPVGALALVLQAGTRFEPVNQAGVSQYMRHYAFQSTEKRTGFRVGKEAEFLGARLSSTLGRETLTLYGDYFKADLPKVVPLLTEALLQPLFAAHELAQVSALVKAETCSPLARLVDELHTAAYRTGLGNPLFHNDERVIGADEIREFWRDRLSKGTLAVIGHGCGEEELVGAVEEAVGSSYQATGTGVDTTKGGVNVTSKFHGDSARANGAGFQGVAIGIDVSRDVFAGRVMAELLNNRPNVRYGSPHSLTAGISAHVDTALFEYSDAAMLGVFIHHSNDAALVNTSAVEVSKVLKQLAANGVDPAQWQRALVQAKSKAVPTERGEWMTQQIAQIGVGAVPVSERETLSGLTKLDPTHVQALSKQAKRAFAVWGNTRVLPYPDDLLI